MLGVDVLTHHGVSRKDQVDLFVPAHGIAIELDPRWSHAYHHERDTTRLKKHQGINGEELIHQPPPRL